MKFLAAAFCTVLSFSAFAVVNESFITAVEKNIDLRKRGIEFYFENQSKFSEDKNLTSKDMRNIFGFATEYAANRSEMWKYISTVKEKYIPGSSIHVVVDRPTKIKWAWGIKNHYINPLDTEGRLALKEILEASVMGQMLFDNYVAILSPYYTHPKIRYIINQDIPELKGSFDQLTLGFYSSEDRRYLREASKVAEDLQALADKGEVALDSYETQLLNLIKSSPTAEYLKKEGLIELRNLKHSFLMLAGHLKLSKRATMFATSQLFGNMMGMFKSRDGYMKNMDQSVKDGITARMKPLDVILEKTPFRLTDTFIPGYYGHVAIWVGTEEELKDLDVWDHPAVVPHHENIRNGHHIIEALRPGVEINTLEHFLDIDDMAVIRSNNELSPEQKKKYLIKAFKQLGKDYDFNFDVETDEAIVCSELAFVVFEHVEWPVGRQMGRVTISPDHVAYQALKGGEFSPVIIFQKGEEVIGDLDQAFNANLFGEEGMSNDLAKIK